MRCVEQRFTRIVGTIGKHRAPVVNCVAGLAVAWLLSPRSAVTPENAAMIEKGMIIAEVEAIMGGAARDETTGPALTCGSPSAVATTMSFCTAHLDEARKKQSG